MKNNTNKCPPLFTTLDLVLLNCNYKHQCIEDLQHKVLLFGRKIRKIWKVWHAFVNVCLLVMFHSFGCLFKLINFDVLIYFFKTCNERPVSCGEEKKILLYQHVFHLLRFYFGWPINQNYKLSLFFLLSFILHHKLFPFRLFM